RVSARALTQLFLRKNPPPFRVFSLYPLGSRHSKIAMFFLPFAGINQPSLRRRTTQKGNGAQNTGWESTMACLNSRKTMLVGAAVLAVGRPVAGLAKDSLPSPPTPSGSKAARTMQQSTYKPNIPVRRLAANAPNILIIMLDDSGPALPSTYG